MMKRSLLICILLLTALLAAGCASGNTAADSAKNQTLPLLQKVEAAAGSVQDLTPFTQDDLADILGIDPEEYTEFVYLQGAGLSGREILVLRAKDRDAAAQIAQRVENYLEQRRKETRDYAPEAYQLLAAAKVETQNLTVALIAGENAAEETKAVLAGE